MSETDRAPTAAAKAPQPVEPDDAWLREYERRKLALLEAAHPVSQPSGYSEDEADAFNAAERALDEWVSGALAARQPGADVELVEQVCRLCQLPEREHRPGYAAHRCAGWVPEVSTDADHIP